MTPHQATRAALYGRVSRRGKRSDEELERHTKNEQRSLAEGFLPRSVELVLEHWDVNVSGRNSDRPALQALFDDVRSGKIDAVIVGYLSRFGRNAKEALQNLEQLHELGATLYVAKEGLIAPPGTRGVSKMLLTILAAVAEMEGDRLADGLALANATALADGVSIQVPYGYVRANGPGSPLMPDTDTMFGPAPADVVRTIFELARDGMGASAIARELNDREIPTPTMLRHLREQRDKPGAQQWQHNAVRTIVETRTYKGVIPVGVAFDDKPYAGGRRRTIAYEERPGQHAALVSDELWNAAQLSSQPAIRNGTTTGALLQGLVRCASCSQTMRPNVAGGDAKGVRTYNCRGKTAGCAAPATITRELVDEYVIDQLLEGATEVHEQDQQRDAELAVVRAELATAERAIEQHVGRADVVDEDDWRVEYAKRKRARDRLRSYERELVERTPEHRELVAQLRELPLDAQREVLRDSLDAVVVRRGRMPVGERVVLIDRGLAPFELSGSGRTVAPRPWPL